MTSTENAIKMCKNTKFPPLPWPRSNSPQLKTLKIHLKKLPNCINSPFNRVSSWGGGGSHSLGMINRENPQLKTPNHKVSELHPILWSFKWGGGESQCWSTGTNKCLRGADRQEHQSEKIKLFVCLLLLQDLVQGLNRCLLNIDPGLCEGEGS